MKVRILDKLGNNKLKLFCIITLNADILHPITLQQIKTQQNIHNMSHHFTAYWISAQQQMYQRQAQDTTVT